MHYSAPMYAKQNVCENYNKFVRALQRFKVLNKFVLCIYYSIVCHLNDKYNLLITLLN